MLNVARACQTCHRYSEEEVKARVETIQGRTKDLTTRAEDALLQMMDAFKGAKEKGVAAEKLSEAQALHRKAQWRLDFVLSENSLGFHAPQESTRILGEAIDFARQAQIKVLQLQR
jgi:nitrite reductase (cytochrome c-552)